MRSATQIAMLSGGEASGRKNDIRIGLTNSNRRQFEPAKVLRRSEPQKWLLTEIRSHFQFGILALS
jgi:hypothetical protein